MNLVLNGSSDVLTGTGDVPAPDVDALFGELVRLCAHADQASAVPVLADDRAVIICGRAAVRPGRRPLRREHALSP